MTAKVNVGDRVKVTGLSDVSDEVFVGMTGTVKETQRNFFSYGGLKLDLVVEFDGLWEMLMSSREVEVIGNEGE